MAVWSWTGGWRETWPHPKPSAPSQGGKPRVPCVSGRVAAGAAPPGPRARLHWPSPGVGVRPGDTDVGGPPPRPRVHVCVLGAPVPGHCAFLRLPAPALAVVFSGGLFTRGPSPGTLGPVAHGAGPGHQRSNCCSLLSSLSSSPFPQEPVPLPRAPASSADSPTGCPPCPGLASVQGAASLPVRDLPQAVDVFGVPKHARPTPEGLPLPPQEPFLRPHPPPACPASPDSRAGPGPCPAVLHGQWRPPVPSPSPPPALPGVPHRPRSSPSSFGLSHLSALRPKRPGQWPPACSQATLPR